MCNFNTNTTVAAISGKKLSIDTVNTVAEFLILTFGKTTTLDVKNNLRKLGFEATQQEVSDTLKQIYEARKAGEYAPYELNGTTVDLTFEDQTSRGTTFRVYSFGSATPAATVKAAPAATATPAATKVAPVATSKDPRSYIKKNINKPSAQLAKELGISVGSVAAYKANINR